MNAFRFSLVAIVWMIAAAAIPSDAAPIIDEKKLRPESIEEPDLARIKASCKGKYKNLLRKIEVPADKGQYGDFCDWGHWNGTSHANYTDLPPGYWVYVAPHWYIWKDRDESKTDNEIKRKRELKQGGPNRKLELPLEPPIPEDLKERGG